MNLRAILITSSLTVGAGIGAFGVSSALSEESTDAPDAHVNPDVPDPVILEPTSGEEPAVFTPQVTRTDSTDTVSVRSVGTNEVCLAVVLDDGSADVCFDERTVASGLAYGAFGESDGGYTIIGVVPDEVDVVELGGSRVELAGNVWSVHVDSDAPAELRVGNSATDDFVVLEAAAK